MRLFIVCLLYLSTTVQAIEVIDLKCESKTKPTGIASAKPGSGWTYFDDYISPGKSGYPTVMATSIEKLKYPDLWDTGPTSKNATGPYRYLGQPFRSGQILNWKATASGNNRGVAHSELAWFEMGKMLLPEKAYKPPVFEKKEIPSVELRKFHTVEEVGIEASREFLEQYFKNPPAEARARSWWHWMNGNVSREGITADLEAMERVGIQEAQLFNVNLGLPFGGIEYLGEEWLDLLEYAATEAHRLGLELAFHNSAGWSSSGGPWIRPENAMQTIVYSELTIQGGTTFSATLPQPETRLSYYRDIAVLAFPSPPETARIDGLDFKTLSDRVRNHLTPDEKIIPHHAIIKKSTIIDLSSKISRGGTLNWKVPPGEWIILRLGHTPTGKKNHPAVKGGHGLECDKMSRKAVDAYWKGGIQPIINQLDTLIGSTVNNCLIDSYEVGTSNWTSGFDEEFKRLRKYDCNLYLPAIAGYYVESGEVTERFLWDFRRTIGDLMAENYYGRFRELCHQYGMRLSVEPYWGPFDNMQVGAKGDIVMCEFWSGGYPFFDSPKFVSSIAHLNGSAVVGAEAFTGIGGWDEHPALLKSIGDRAWAQGINRLIFHTYVHQPWNTPPGLALSYHGTDFNRLNTWWEQSKAYMDYIARSQFLLQQGKSINDVLVFTGESSPNNALLMPEIKRMGFDYDLMGVNKLFELTVKQGRIYTPSGGIYRVLVLPDSKWMRPETILKIEELANAGAKIIGRKPHKSPGLTDFPECDIEVQGIADNLWGKKRIEDISIIDFLENDSFPSDFNIQEGNLDDLSFAHRKTGHTDIYFVANARKESRQELCRFRVSDKQPEIWNAQTGTIEPVAVWKENGDGTTSVPISFASEQSVFIIFRTPGLDNHITEVSLTPEKTESQMLSGLEILKAEYGSFLQNGLVDITDRVSQAVENGSLDIRATRHFCDCDPAMGYKKEFRMEYTMGGELHQLSVMEGEEVKIDAGDRGELKIRKAVFGKFLPKTKGVPEQYPVHEITDKIKAFISADVFDIPVDKLLIGGKSAEGENPALRVTFKTDGETRTLTVREGKVLKLSKDIPTPRVISQNGKVMLLSPYPVDVIYTRATGKQKKAKVAYVPEPYTISGPWEVSFPVNPDKPLNVTLRELDSWSNSSKNQIRHFSGTATYRQKFNLPEELLASDYSLELDLGSVYVIAEVIVNGENLGIWWKSPFRISADSHLHAGKNMVEIRITNLWPNRLIGDESLPGDIQWANEKIWQWPDWLINDAARTSGRTTFPSYRHWEMDSELQPSGLLGPVRIIVYKRELLE